MKEVIYVDYNATTPLAEEAVEEMAIYLRKGWGNPSSSHIYGQEAKSAVDSARGKVAKMINAKSNEIIFTSGGSESNNWAIKGVAFEHHRRGNHIITSNFEHPAVTEVLSYLETKGFRVTYVPVDRQGIINLKELTNSITDSTILITVMHANNEIGTIQPISEIVKLAKAKNNNILIHTDASQSIGKIKVDVTELGVDLLTVTPHKFYGPKGVGALYIRSDVKLEKFIHGAGHEWGHRAGTENVLLEVGFGVASELVSKHLDTYARHMEHTRDLLHSSLLKRIPGLRLNGHPKLRLPNTLNVSFPSVRAADLLRILQGKVAASAGAACHSNTVKISSVLKAIGLTEQEAIGTVRFSTGRYLSESDVSKAVDLIVEAFNSLTKSKL